MGQPRPGRKKVVVVSSDEEEEEQAVEDILSDIEEDEEDVRPNTRSRKAPNTAGTSKSAAKTTAASKTKPAPQASQSQSTKRKAKASIDPNPKRGNRSISSFFNAATERQQAPQQAPQRSVSPNKSIISEHDHEDIQDAISDDETPIALSKGSQTAMAMRKRKLQNDPFLNVSDSVPPPATNKFRKISDETRVPGKAAEEDHRPWTEQFAPVNLSELAVHTRKVTDVRNLLESALSERARPRLIVLKGAAGTGKTTAVNLLAKDLDVQIKEWRNPAGADMSSSSFVSASAQFEDFILRSGKFAGLELVTGDGAPTKSASKAELTDTEARPQIMLVEEFPNTFAKTSGVLQAFRTTIQQFLASPRLSYSKPTPLIMIISETLLSTSTTSSDSFTAHRLLGPQILNHPQTATVEFNAVAPGILTAALSTIVQKEARKSGRRRTPGLAVLKHLAETGDIRSAVSTLEFLCLRGDESIDTWSARVAFTKPKRNAPTAPLTKQEQASLKLISNRESSLHIFHAVGKVIYNKRSPTSSTAQPPNHLPQHRRPKPPDLNVDALLNDLGTDTSTFIAALHENYALSCNTSSSEDTLDALNGCLDALSDADLLSPDRFGTGTRSYSGSAQDNLRQDDLSFSTAVRGLLFALPEKVQRGGDSSKGNSKGPSTNQAFQMFYPQSLRLWRKKEELESMLELVTAGLQNSDIAESSSSRKEGVETWRRNNTFDFSASAPEEAAPLPQNLFLASAAAKQELLLDRLPFTSLILASRPSAPQMLIQNIAALTRISGTSDPRSSLEEEEDVAGDGGQKGTFERKKEKGDREGGGLGIPVERAVEGLVLSDDDIVDD